MVVVPAAAAVKEIHRVIEREASDRCASIYYHAFQANKGARYTKSTV